MNVSFSYPSRRAARLTPLALALSLACGTAWAQSSAEDAHRADAKALDAIIVTASPLRSSVEQISQPVDVLAGARLDEVRAATLGETVESLPGVQSSNFGPGVGRPIIRGLDGARIAVLSDGLATSDVSTVSQDHAPAIEPFLADQIEVLKGPSTLLYGSGAIGGVVNVVNGRIPETTPENGFSGRAEARYDSVSDGHTGMARVDVGGDAFALHVDGVFRDNQDYDLPGPGKQANSYLQTQTGSVGGSVLGDWGFVGAAVSRYEDEYGNPGEPGDPAEGELGVHLELQQDRYEVKGGINDPFAGFSSLRFSGARTEYQHTEFEGAEVGTKFLKDGNVGRIELAHEPIAGWTGAFGLQGNDTQFEAIGEEAFVPKTQTRGLGLFLVEQKQWDALQLDLGARIDDISSDPANAQKRSFNPFSASLGAIWNVADRWDLIANLDHAERAPAEEELFANGPHIATAAFEIGNAQLTEEAANQFELGVHFHGERVQAKLSAYYNKFKDYIYLVDTGAFVPGEDGELPVRQWSQADATFRGVEGEATFSLADNDSGNWDLRTYGDYVRATLDDGGNVPRISPARLGAELRWKNQGLRANLGAVRYAKQDDLATNETPTDGYTFVNAGVAYHWDVATSGWEVFVNGTNLTNQVGRVHTSFLKDVVELPGVGVSTGLRIFF